LIEVALLAIGFIAGSIAVATYAKNKIATAELQRDKAQCEASEARRSAEEAIVDSETVLALAAMSPQEKAIKELVADGAINDYTGYYILARHAHGDIDFVVPAEVNQAYL
jgi:hypothetical protein